MSIRRDARTLPKAHLNALVASVPAPQRRFVQVLAAGMAHMQLSPTGMDADRPAKRAKTGTQNHYMTLWNITQDLCKQWTTDQGAIGCRNLVALFYMAAKLFTGSGDYPYTNAVMSFFPKDESWFNFENRFLGFYIREKTLGKRVKLSDGASDALEDIGGVKCEVLMENDGAAMWAQTINTDCKVATKDKIKAIIDAQTLSHPYFHCFLLAAEYMKVNWANLFNMRDTEENAPFYGWKNGKRETGGTCKMMKNSGEDRHHVFRGAHCRAVFLPTVKEDGITPHDVQIMAVLPNDPETEGVTGDDSPIQKASKEIAERGSDLLTTVAGYMSHTVVQIPRMELKMNATNVTGLCKRVFPPEMFVPFQGLSQAFNEQTGAWEPFEDMEIALVNHATYILMNEIGAVAAAASGGAVFVSLSSEPPPPELIRFDRPYLVYIVDMTSSQPVTLFKTTVMHSGPLADVPAPSWDEYNAALAKQQGRFASLSA